MATPSARAVPADSITLSRARRDGTRLAAGLVLAAVGSLAAAGPQFTSGVNVVEVYATVTDARGQPVTGLTRADFVVRENGQAQEISTFAAGEFPLSVALALDRSFSMGGERLALAKSGARVFLGELRPEDRSMLIAVGSQVEIVAPLSADRAAQLDVISRLDAFGTTGLYDSIVTAIDAIQQAAGRRVLVLLSDGADRYSTATADEAVQHARRSDVLVYPVALGRERPPVFAELATLTGGRSSYLREPKALTETLRGIARELRHQYLIGYSPSRPIVAGGNEWRAIEVRVSRPDVQVRARDGYLIK
jgi:Ca-activated chloride channel family protein